MANDETLSHALKDALELTYKLRDHAEIAQEWHMAVLKLSTRLNDLFSELTDMAASWDRESRLLGDCLECGGSHMDECADQLREKLGEIRNA